MELVLGERDLGQARGPDRPVAVGDVADLGPAEQVDQPRVDRDPGVAGARVAVALGLAHPPRADDEVGLVARRSARPAAPSGRVVLAVGIERHDDVDAQPLGDEVAGLERRALAAVDRVADDVARRAPRATAAVASREPSSITRTWVCSPATSVGTSARTPGRLSASL